MVGRLEEVSADCAGFLHLITKKLLDLCKSRPQFMYSKELYVSRLRIVMKVKVTQSCLTLCNPMDSSSQPLLSMEFSRQEYLRKLPFPSPGDLPNPGIEPRSPALQADSLLPEPPGKPFAAKSLQLCPTLCDPRDGSSPASPVPGILQARTLEWAAISFSNA